ncbi:MAG: ABC transporter permease [Gorillibacterium sp.]|nr:ABC transporter permease [Gorillibacterium sp.]
MHSFGNLVVNESIKLIKKRSFIISLAIAAAMSIAFAYIFQATSYDITSAAHYTEVFMARNGAGQMLAFIVIICTAGIVAKEHSQGTIKFLLIRSQSRSKILASKYVVVVLYTLLLMLFAMGVSYMIGGFLFGFSGGETSGVDVWRSSLYTCIYTLVYTTLTFMVGVLTRSSGAATGIGMFAVMLSGLIIPREFYKYVLFANTDLSVYTQGNSPIAGMNLSFSAVVLVVYVAVFLAIGFITFNKRDVA